VVRGFCVLVLLQLQIVVFQDQDRGFVFIRTAVVWRREDGDYVREAVFAAPLVHAKAVLLYLVSTEDTQQFVTFEQRLYWLLSEVNRALTIWVVLKVAVYRFIVVHRVSPHQIAERAFQRNLSKPIDLIDLVDLGEVFRNSTVHSKVFLRNQSRYWQCVKDLHKKIVNFLIVTLKHFLPKSERFRHVA
jgi:hypothetical protein